MIKKYCYGEPYNTNSCVLELEAEKDAIKYFSCESSERGLSFTIALDEDDAIYGLGENVRGINKRGFVYRSFNVDDAPETESKSSLYSSHNFVVFKGKNKCFGAYFDDPAMFEFDLGYTDPDRAVMTSRYGDLTVYIIDGDSVNAVVKEFRRLIGRSYLPPKWAFGYIQSRFGDAGEENINNTLDEYEKLNMPIDAFCIDIDGLDGYQNFSWHKENFKDPQRFVNDMLERGIHLVPIVDAAIKQDMNNPEYASGKKADVFCKDKDGEDFSGYVWPGKCVFPDYFREETRKWFGHNYQNYLNMGVHGFWNDMNEPALFASDAGFQDAVSLAMEAASWDSGEFNFLKMAPILNMMKLLYNEDRDCANIFHNVDGRRVSNLRVHNMYGAMMSRAADEGFREYDPHKRFLLFTRSLYIGSHRYTGTWLGDNHAWWSHLLMNLKMLPSMNMCGYLFTGADIGGFNENTTDELMLRWLELGIFFPLMRNHSAWATRNQELYRFKYREKMAKIVNIRYALIPYLYSEFMKAALRDESVYRPLAFDYPDDERAKRVEDQIMLGGECMIAPVYEQNGKGRYVYLPEDMLMLRLSGVDEIEELRLSRGDHYIDLDTDQLAFFIKKNKAIPFASPARRVKDIDCGRLRMLGWLEEDYGYELYDDDGLSKNVSLDNIKTLHASATR